jgi:hypothetical protein
MLTYNLFRHRDDADLYCAVPQDQAVPSFLTDHAWEYAEALDVTAFSKLDLHRTPGPLVCLRVPSSLSRQDLGPGPAIWPVARSGRSS